MNKLFPKFLNTTNTQIQEAQWTSRKRLIKKKQRGTLSSNC